MCGSRREADVAIGGDTLVVKNDFETAGFLIAEHRVIGIVEEKDTEAVSSEGVLRRELK